MATITNISMAGNLNCNIDLNLLTNNSLNCVYQKNCFRRVLKFNKQLNTTVMIYSNGKLVCVGAKHVRDGVKAMKIVNKVCLRLGFKVNLSHICVTNMAATYNTGHKVNLCELSTFIGGSYEPELFPNLIFEMGDKKKINISRNGKIILTGIKTESDLNFLLIDFIF